MGIWASGWFCCGCHNSGPCFCFSCGGSSGWPCVFQLGDGLTTVGMWGHLGPRVPGGTGVEPDRRELNSRPQSPGPCPASPVSPVSMG